MESKVKLKDGTQVLIRPIKKDDLERSFAFFQALPEEDRMFLRVDVSKRKVVENRIKKVKTGAVKRLVAVLDDEIVADGTLEFEGHGWKEHVGELRLIVARSQQRKGLGLLMARELYALAAKHRVEEIVVRMMRPQQGARSIFRRLGFREMVMLPDYVKDLHGDKQDLIVMRCKLEALLNELKDLHDLGDWGRTR
jgi:acetyltransferase